MGRIRILVGVAAAASSLSLVAGEARAITLPDSSSCSTASPNGCLKIENTDANDAGPTIYGVNDGYGAAIRGSGFVALEAQGGYYGVNASAFIGVFGQTNTNGMGVYGSAGSAASSYGVYGYAAGSGAFAVYGTASGTNGNGVYGTGPIGVHGVSTASAVLGEATGSSTSAYGVKGTSSNGYGVYGFSSNGTGVFAQSNSGTALMVNSGGTTAPVLWVQNLTNPDVGVLSQVTGSGTAIRGENQNPDGNGWAGYFQGRVYSTDWFYTNGWQSSDARLKKEVAAAPYGLSAVAALRPVVYKWKDSTRANGRQIGFIAQEIQNVVPEVVNKEASSGMLSVNYTGLIPVAVKAIQEQQVMIREQQATIARQEARIQALEQRPIVASMFSGGVNLSVAIGAFAALAFNVIRRRKQQAAK
jgi:hypothetical protein